MFEKAWQWRNVPLPEAHLLALAVGLAVDHRSLRKRQPVANLIAGIGLMLLGVSLIAWAVAASGEMDMARPTRRVTSGPYFFLRHPMYIGWHIVYGGIVALTGSRALLALAGPLVLATRLTSRREEARLTQQFG